MASPNTYSIQLGTLKLSLQLTYPNENWVYPIVRIAGEILEDTISNPETIVIQPGETKIYVVQAEGFEYVSGLFRFSLDDSTQVGIYANLSIGSSGNQVSYHELILAISPNNCWIPLESIQYQEEEIIPTPDPAEEIAIQNPAFQSYSTPSPINQEQFYINPEFTSLFQFVGLHRPSSIPSYDQQHFFFLDTDSTFYKSLVGAAKNKKPLLPLAQAYLSGPSLAPIQPLLDQDFFEILRQYEMLLHEVKQKSTAEAIIIPALLGEGIAILQSLEIEFLTTVVTLLKDAITAVMICLLAGDEKAGKLVDKQVDEQVSDKKEKKSRKKSIEQDAGAQKPTIGVINYEQYLLLLRMITWYLSHDNCGNSPFQHASLTAIPVLPDFIFKALQGDMDATSPSTSGSVGVLGIAELKVVEQGRERYETGEIAHIESIMPGERKKQTRVERQISESTEQNTTQNQSENSRSNEELTDYTLRQAMESLLKKGEESFSYTAAPASGAGATSSTPTGLTKTFTDTSEVLSGGWTLDLEPAQEEEQTFRFVRALTASAANLMHTHSRKTRAKRLFHELSQTDERIFDNRTGANPMIGIYRWVNKVSQARIRSKGLQLLFAFTLPTPADGFPFKDELVFSGELPPEDLLEQASYTSLTSESYFDWASRLGIEDLLLPPEAQTIISSSLSSQAQQEQALLAIPEGYEATEANITYLYNGTKFEAVVGDQSSLPKDDLEATPPPSTPPAIPPVPPMEPATITGKNIKVSLTKLSPEVPVSILTDATFYTANISITCTVSDISKTTWQVRAWMQILAAARKKAFADNGMPKSRQSIRNHDALARQVRNTLRKEAIAVLLATLQAKNPGLNPADWESALSDYFLWNHLVIRFQSESPDDHWREFDLHRLTEADFQQFLLAKSVQVIVAVRKSEELSALYAIWTQGKVWEGVHTDPPILSSYLFYADTLKFHRQKPGHHHDPRQWKITVPTDLLILDTSGTLPDVIEPDVCDVQDILPNRLES